MASETFCRQVRSRYRAVTVRFGAFSFVLNNSSIESAVVIRLSGAMRVREVHNCDDDSSDSFLLLHLQIQAKY